MKIDVFNQTGKMAIGSRLRMLTDKITEDASLIYQLYGVDLKAKWFPVFFVLSNGEPRTITSIAKEIGHSHPSVSTIIKEMTIKGFVKQRKDPNDGRRNVVELSSKGRSVAQRMSDQYADVSAAIENLSKQTKHDLWKAIEEWEFLLSEKALLKRVEEAKKVRESLQVQIVAYEPCYRDLFKALNEEWIQTYFEMEEADHKALEDPQKDILQNGGHIFVALYNREPVGVCALLKMDDGGHDFELAKMAVSPVAQGKNIGFLWGKQRLKGP